MRWVKHLSMAHSDQAVAYILEEFGPTAYGVYWLIIEDISAPMEAGKLIPEASHSIAKWASICHCSVKLFTRIVQGLASKHLIFLIPTEDRLTIEVRNILKYKDEYSKKSGVTPSLIRERADREQRESESRGEKRALTPGQPDLTKPADPLPKAASNGNGVHYPPPALPAPIDGDAEARIRKLADSGPDQQDYEVGISSALDVLRSASDPPAVLVAMEDTIPMWWAAMLDGRARVKPLRFVIADQDYLRRPRDPPSKSKNGAATNQKLDKWAGEE